MIRNKDNGDGLPNVHKGILFSAQPNLAYAARLFGGIILR